MFSLYASPYCTPIAAPEPSFTTLFRLLDDFDSYNREVQAPQQQQQEQQQKQKQQPKAKPQQRRQIRRTVTTTFKPAVDVRETGAAYELHVELPGIQKENLNLEFTDPQTLVVSGRVERTYESKPEEETTATATDPETAPAAADEKATDADETASNASSHGWHHATVEDDPEEPGTPTGTMTPVETPKTEVAKPAAPTTTAVQKAPEAPKEKVWLYERSIGQFSRTFTFPTRVEHENVSASLENGVLSITVPKAPKHQVRRIAIF